MNNKIVLGIIAVLLIGGLVFLSKKPPTKGGNQTAKKIVKNVEKTMGETGSIQVPSNIKKVTDELRQKYENQICEKEPVSYCEY